MSQRVRFDLRDGEPFSVQVSGKTFGYRGCQVFAEIGDLPAGVYNTIFKSPAGEYAKVTIVAEEGADMNPLGIHHGWHASRIVTEDEAQEIRRSWSILREQPQVSER